VDRTSEFMAAVRALQVSGAESAAECSRVPELTQFSKTAGLVSRGIHQTNAKLDRLAKLAKRQSLYEDHSPQVRELTSAVRADLSMLETELQSLQQLEARNPTKQSADNNIAIVLNLRAQLAGATKSLTDILQVRSAAEKEQNSRRQTFEDPVSRSLPKSKSNRFVDGEQLQESVVQDQYLSGRVQEVENIEGVIHELGQMYAKLTSILEVQGEMAIRIDENMNTTLEHVDRGHGELLVHANRLSGNQWLIIKVFAVLISFSTFFVIFVA